MELNLTGKVALVTGSTSGIGLGIAERLAEEGCTTIMNAHLPAEEVTGVLSELAEKYDGEIEYRQADMSNPDAIGKLLEGIISHHQQLDILVNNAGVQVVSPIQDFKNEDWENVQDINLNSAFHTTKAAFPGMLKRGWGRIIHIASAHGLVASAFKAAYVTAKHGMIGLGKVTALEGAEHGIPCNMICPGYVLTPLVDQQIDDQAKVHKISRDRVIAEIMLTPQPTKKFVQIEEIAALAAFLCSDHAASITGAAIPIDGGWTAR